MLARSRELGEAEAQARRRRRSSAEQRRQEQKSFVAATKIQSAYRRHAAKCSLAMLKACRTEGVRVFCVNLEVRFRLQMWRCTL